MLKVGFWVTDEVRGHGVELMREQVECQPHSAAGFVIQEKLLDAVSFAVQYQPENSLSL